MLAVAPLGVFALAFTVGAAAGGRPSPVLAIMSCIISVIGILVTLAAYPLAAIAGRMTMATFTRGLIAPQTVAISTRSSLASLPAMLTSSRVMGIREEVSDVTLPIAVGTVPRDGPGDEHRGRLLRRALARASSQPWRR